MTIPPSAVTAAGLLCLGSPLATAEVVSAALNLENESNVNELAISLAIPEFETGNDKTRLSGWADTDLQIDPATGSVTQLTFTGGSISGTPIVLSGNSTLLVNPGSYSFSSSTLSGRLNTLAPPGTVDNTPGAGDFMSARHEVIINGGTLGGLLSSTFVSENVNHDFGSSPVAAKGTGIGTVSASFRADLSTQQTSVFDLVVFLGVGSSTDVPAGSATVTFGISGTIKLAGQVSVPYLPLIYNFSPDPQIVVNGDSTGLDYDVAGASWSSIDRSEGSLSPANYGKRTVVPPPDTDTVYTFTAGNGNGSVSRSTIVRSVSQGSATFRYLRFTPVRLKGDLPGYPAADSIQISEFQFFDGSTQRIPVSAANPGGSNPSGEGADKLIDGDAATKWLDFNRGCVVFDFGTAETISRYRFRTANDFEQRDPVAWTLEGSDGQTAWAVVDAITIRQDDYSQAFNHFTPAARNAFTQSLPVPASPTVPPVVITRFASSPQIVVNGVSTVLAWETVSATSLEIGQSIGSVSGASGSVSVNAPPNADSKFTLTAGNGTGLTTTAETLVRSVGQGSATFRYLRFTPVRLAESLPGFSAANSIQLAGFEFFNGVIPVIPAAVTNPGGSSPPGEGVGNVLDGNPATKWLDFNKKGLLFDFGASATVTAYRWKTGNDEPSRDPVAWILEGSGDGTAWQLVDNVTRNRTNPSENVAVYAGMPRGATTPRIPIPDAESLLPVIMLFVGDAPFLIAGEPLRLTWNTGGATRVTVEPAVGAVASAGSLVDTPAFDRTYTLTATSPAGSVSEQFTTIVVTPTIRRICYEGFDDAGHELGLLGDSAIVNDFDNIPLPGNVARLRLTPDSGGKSGAAWFRRRVDLSQGFQSWFDLQFMGADDSGADALSFVVQNSPEGTGAEQAPDSMALTIRFDSYFNGGDEPSAGFIRVYDGERVLATVDLTTIGGIRLPGSVPNDLSSDDFNAAPYSVHIAYVPGDLDLYFDGVRVIDSLAVDLAAAGAVDDDGRGYVGFTASTGAYSESHDVTRWVLVEGPSTPPLRITGFAVDLETDTAVFTFTSTEFRTYAIETSADGITFTELVSGISGAAGANETTTPPVAFTETPIRLFRVVSEKP